MSPSPQTQHDSRSAKNYRDSWRAIMRLVRNGTSWSGSERNCAFLNCTQPQSQPRFANSSAVTGLDFDDDGRAMAVVDWDHDGDLDIWLRNRTAPRLRLMANRTNEIQPNSQFVSIRLVGTTCNRDAIGARVELICQNSLDGQRRIRTVRAGDAFLSQSSKSVHFGLPIGVEPEKVIVHWPGGASETFGGIASGFRYELKQASGTANRLRKNTPAVLVAKELIPLKKTAAARVVMPGRIAFPNIGVNFNDANASAYQFSGKPTLFTFWSSSCPNCRQELSDFAKQFGEMENAGLDVIAVCLDELESPTESSGDAVEFLREIQFPFKTARTNSRSLELLRDFQDTLFGKTPEFVIPLSVLVDGQGDVIAIYRGSFPATVFAQDQEIGRRNDEARRILATPFQGTWITKPATPTQFAEFVGKRLFEKAPEESLRYYEIAMNAEPNANRQTQLRKQIASTHLSLAKQAQSAGDNARTARHFESALRLAPKSAAAHRAYGIFLNTQGETEKAKKHLQAAATMSSN